MKNINFVVRVDHFGCEFTDQVNEIIGHLTLERIRKRWACRAGCVGMPRRTMVLHPPRKLEVLLGTRTRSRVAFLTSCGNASLLDLFQQPSYCFVAASVYDRRSANHARRCGTTESCRPSLLGDLHAQDA
jgi:hypothetical protein